MDLHDYNVDYIALIFFIIATPMIILFFLKAKGKLQEIANRYNGSLECPYFGIPLGVRIPFRDRQLLFDPYCLLRPPKKRARKNRTSLSWQAPESWGIENAYIERSGERAQIEKLTFVKGVKTNDALFDSSFDILARDEERIRTFLSPDLRQQLIAKSDSIFALEIDHNKIYLLHKDILKSAEEWTAFIDHATEVMHRIVQSSM